VGTGSQDKQRDHEESHPRWARLERAERFERDGALHTQGVSRRQAAKVLDVPRSTRPAWRPSQDSLDACPVVVAFCHRVPGLAFLPHLVLAFPLVGVEVGGGGMRLVCLVWELTGRKRFGGLRRGPSRWSTGALQPPSWPTATRSARGSRTRCLPKPARCRRRKR
jgi:hypothetical protein